jgi:hypothetical protein
MKIFFKIVLNIHKKNKKIIIIKDILKFGLNLK